jgi:hypothetical protein
VRGARKASGTLHSRLRLYQPPADQQRRYERFAVHLRLKVSSTATRTGTGCLPCVPGRITADQMIAAARTKREADPELARPLRHKVRHQPKHSNARQDERQDRERDLDRPLKLAIEQPGR